MSSSFVVEDVRCLIDVVLKINEALTITCEMRAKALDAMCELESKRGFKRDDDSVLSAIDTTISNMRSMLSLPTDDLRWHGALDKEREKEFDAVASKTGCDYLVHVKSEHLADSEKKYFKAFNFVKSNVDYYVDPISFFERYREQALISNSLYEMYLKYRLRLVHLSRFVSADEHLHELANLDNVQTVDSKFQAYSVNIV